MKADMLNISKDKYIHFIGIGGIGVSGVAKMMLEKGYPISGSDTKDSRILDYFRKKGVPIFLGHALENIQNAALLVYSTAISEDNVERKGALDRGIRQVHRSELLSYAISEMNSFGVTGTHGKGTVSSIAAWILECLGLRPNFIIGAMLKNFQTNARFTPAKDIVVEIDESDKSHLNVFPKYLTVNNLDLDHLNFYKDIDDIVKTMREFIEKNTALKGFSVNIDDPGIAKMMQGLLKKGVTYGLQKTADIYADHIFLKDYSSEFELFINQKSMGRMEINLPGFFNVYNALGAISLLYLAYKDLFTRDVLHMALSSFLGLENRFEIVKVKDIYLVKDYISHPTGMRQVLAAARAITTGQIYVIFKPYRYTLIKYLQDEYATAFIDADHVVITELYAAEEAPIPGIDENFLMGKIQKHNPSVEYVPKLQEIEDFLARRMKSGDLALFFGGDDLFAIADHFKGTVEKDYSGKN